MTPKEIETAIANISDAIDLLKAEKLQTEIKKPVQDQLEELKKGLEWLISSN